MLFSVNMVTSTQHSLLLLLHNSKTTEVVLGYLLHMLGLKGPTWQCKNICKKLQRCVNYKHIFSHIVASLYISCESCDVYFISIHSWTAFWGQHFNTLNWLLVAEKAIIVRQTYCHQIIQEQLRYVFCVSFLFFFFKSAITYSWNGGKKLSQTDDFSSMCVTKKEYEEHGQSICQERFDVWWTCDSQGTKSTNCRICFCSQRHSFERMVLQSVIPTECWSHRDQLEVLMLVTE